MQKIVDDVRLIVKCCKLYYEENYTQNEISNMMGVSRPTVSRILKEGKNLGIVKIEILSPLRKNFEELERQTERRYNIREVIIVDDEAEDAVQKKQAAKAAAEYLQRIIKNGDVIGVSMGTTIKGISNYITNPEKMELMFVPLIGGVGQSEVEIHPNEIVKDLAQAFGGEFKFLHAPAVVSNVNIKKELLKDKSIKEVLDYSRRCNIALVGVGSPFDKNSTMMTTGYFNEQDTKEFAVSGIVGDICLHFYDITGDSERFDFNKRVIGVDLPGIKKINTVIGVACGEKKTAAIKGALNGKIIDVLITNYSNALAINKE